MSGAVSSNIGRAAAPSVAWPRPTLTELGRCRTDASAPESTYQLYGLDARGRRWQQPRSLPKGDDAEETGRSTL